MLCTILLGIFSVTFADSWSYPYNAAEWGNVSATCVEGLNQSPVDLLTHPGIAQKELNVSAEMPTNVVTSSDDTLTWSVNAVSLPMLYLEERSYELSKVQCHIGSEHTVEGSQYPGSCQFYFQLGNEFVVIALLMDDISSNKNAAFDDLLNNVQLDWNRMISGLDISYYWEYTGSLTTPDCEENVRWFVLVDVIEVTTAQIDQMKTISGVDSSFRDTMPLNGRAVNDGSAIGNVSVLWFVIVGFCSEEEVRQFEASIGYVLGLSAEEMVIVHILEEHGGDGIPEPIDVWDVYYKLDVIDNTRTFRDRFLENIGVGGTANANVTNDITEHFNQTHGKVYRFVPIRATILSDDENNGGVDVYIIVIIVVVIILLCLAVAIYFYLRNRKTAKQVAVEITVDDGNMGSQTKM